MIPTMISYFFFMSVAWMSVVSVELSQGELRVVYQFLLDIRTQRDWVPAFHDIETRKLLDRYIEQNVSFMGKGVNTYLKSIHPEANYAKNPPPAPGPDLSAALNGFPKLVLLICYSSLRILNDLKPFLGPEGDQGLLGKIDDTYLRMVSHQYRSVQPGHPGYGVARYMIGLALQFSMNKTMLVFRFTGDQRALLERYQHVITTLQNHVARFMQISIQHPYSVDVNRMVPRITFIQNHLRDYNNPNIQKMVNELSRKMIMVILIYALYPETGMGILSDLLDTTLAIRQFLGVDNEPILNSWTYSRTRLSSLVEPVCRIADLYKDVHPWIAQLRSMVVEILLVGEPIYDITPDTWDDWWRL